VNAASAAARYAAVGVGAPSLSTRGGRKDGVEEEGVAGAAGPGPGESRPVPARVTARDTAGDMETRWEDRPASAAALRHRIHWDVPSGKGA
jgi:hypothetical protein